MDFRPKQFYRTAVPEREEVVVHQVFNVYFRDATTNKLGCIAVTGMDDYRDAAIAVQETLIASGDGYNEPVLTVIQGGKQ